MADFDPITKYLLSNFDSSTPIIYRRLALMTLIGGVYGRRVRVSDGERVVYPNMYTMLVGDSGNKKSTAIQDAVKFMGELGYHNFPNVRSPGDKFLDDFIDRTYEFSDSVESMLDSRVGHANLTLAIDEAKDFFCSGKSDISAALTRIHDCPDSYVMASIKGKKSVDYPTLSFIGGATCQTFADILPPEHYHNGLLARMLLVFESVKPQFVAQPKLDSALYFAAAKDLRENMSSLERSAVGGNITMHLANDALAELNKICTKDFGPRDSRLRSYKERRRDHLLKLAMIVNISIGAIVISKDVITYSNSILAYLESTMHFALGGFGLGKNGRQSTEILTTLLAKDGKLVHSVLGECLGHSVTNMQELSDILSHLVRCNTVSNVQGENNSGYFALKKREALHKDLTVFVNQNMLCEYRHSEFVLNGGKSDVDIIEKLALLENETHEQVKRVISEKSGRPDSEVAGVRPAGTERIITGLAKAGAATGRQASPGLPVTPRPSSSVQLGGSKGIDHFADFAGESDRTLLPPHDKDPFNGSQPF